MHLYENGDVLALFSGEGIVKLNARSEILWAQRNKAHHDVAVAADGDIYVLTRKASVIPRLHGTKPILEDYVTVMAPDGKTKKSFSLLEAFERSPFPDAWKSELEHGDVFHSNTLVLLDGCGCERVPALKKGNLLVSMAIPDALAVLDPESEQVVWVHKGEFRTQHDVQIVGVGNLLLFDNEGLSMASRALELDPATGRTVWEYRGNEEAPLYSKRMGAVQRLPNGNTLITESENGRAIEVTAEGEIVWEYYTPYRGGENGEFIASICRMTRLAPGFPVDWIPSR
jgi:outer membrane protein assembly factor BamB